MSTYRQRTQVDLAMRELDYADDDLNRDGTHSDYWSVENRRARAAYHVSRAQVHATLAVALTPVSYGGQP